MYILSRLVVLDLGGFRRAEHATTRPSRAQERARTLEAFAYSKFELGKRAKSDFDAQNRIEYLIGRMDTLPCNLQRKHGM